MHLLQYFDKLSLKPENAKELKGLILDLAIRGRLTKEWRNSNSEEISLKKLANLTKTEIKDLEKEYSKIELNIPASWCKSYFKRVLDIKGGSQPPKSNFISEDRHGYVRLYQIRDFGNKPVPVYVPKDLVTKFCTEQDVMIGRYGASIGKVFMGKNGAYNVALVKLIFDREVFDTTFIYYFFKTSSMQDFFGNSNRSAQAGFNKTDLGVLEMPIPPLTEQKAIVKIVNQLMAEVDQLEAQTKARIQLRHDFIQSSLRQLTTADSSSEWKKLQPQFNSFFDTVESIDKLKEAILQLAVQGNLTKQWRENNPNVEPASLLLEKIKDEKARLIKEKKIKKEKPLPEITEEEIPFEVPEGWVWCRFIEIASIASNLVDPSLYQHMPHIAPNVIEKNSGRLLDYKTIKEDEVISSKNFFHSGQIVYSKIRPNLNKLIIVDFEGLCSADMYPIDSYIHTEYLFRFMLSTVFLEQSVKTDTRVAMPKINQTELKKILIPVAPLSEQKLIAQSVHKLLKYCDQIKSELKNRNSFSDAFLQSSIREVMKKTQSLA